MSNSISSIVTIPVAKRPLDATTAKGLSEQVAALLEKKVLTENIAPSMNPDAFIRALDATRKLWSGPADPAKSDGRLAPIIHATIRVSPRQAAHRGLWLTLAQFPVVAEYLFARWSSGNGAVPVASHLNGDYSHQGIARLWWMAELLRDGADYSFVSRGFEDQNVPNQAFRSLYFYSRPFARAFTEEVLEYHDNKNAKHPRGKRVDQSAKAVNAALGTVLLESICKDSAVAETDWKAWTRSSPSPAEVERWLAGDMPIGPEGGSMSSDDLRRAKRWMIDFYREWDPSAFTP